MTCTQVFQSYRYLNTHHNFTVHFKRSMRILNLKSIQEHTAVTNPLFDINVLTEHELEPDISQWDLTVQYSGH